MRESFYSGKDGASGLFAALKEGHADAVRAYRKLLNESKLAKMTVATLLATLDDDKTHGLKVALQNERGTKPGRTLMYCKTLIYRARRSPLCFSRDRSGTLFLYEALDQGNAGTIQAYGALREAVQLREESVARLLAAQRKDGTPRLYSALAHGHADAVKAYRNLFPDLPVERLIRLLVAKRNDGKPEPFTALHERHAEVIRAYGALLQTLPMQASSSELLAAVNEHGIQGLHIAVQTRCWKAVEQYTRSRDTLSDDGGRKLV